MKKFCLMLGFLLICIVSIVAQSVVEVAPAVGTSNDKVVAFQILFAALSMLYEAVVRLVPTSKSWSILTRLGHILEWISNLFKILLPDRTTSPDKITHDKLPPQPM